MTYAGVFRCYLSTVALFFQNLPIQGVSKKHVILLNMYRSGKIKGTLLNESLFENAPPPWYMAGKKKLFKRFRLLLANS